MQASSERRAPFSPRIPLDDVLIRLSHHDFEETFEADAVNVGLGGLSMRAAVLPDIGSQLHCQFRSPTDGSAISAACEVVWAEDNGPHVGEFGLRFTEIGEDSEESIRGLMDAIEPEAPHGLAAEPSRVSIRLEGVGSAIATTLASRQADEAILEQELPFLRLGTGVEEVEGGRRGRLDGVDLRIVDGSPRIILTVRYDAEREAPADVSVIQHLEQTLRIDQVASQKPVDIGADADADIEASETAESGDMDTLRDHLPPALAPDESPDAMLEVAVEAPRGVTVDRPSSRPGHRVSSPGDLGLDSSEAIHRARARDARAALGSLVADLGPRLEKLKLVILAAWSRLLPGLRMVRMKIEQRRERLRERVVPYVRHLFGRSVRVVLSFARNLRERVGPSAGGQNAPRRSTSLPPGMIPRGGESRGREAPPRANRRRTTLLTVAAFIGVGLGAYALTPSEGAAEAEVAEESRESSQEAAVAAPSENAPTEVVITESSAPSSAQPVAPQMPRAMPEPTYQAGQMPAPSYPSLQNGARPPAPRSIPSSSPYAVDVRGAEGGTVAEAAPVAPSGSKTFGDETVANGRSFTLRMSQPIRSIDGSRTEDGFTVRVTDSLSLSRAGPIAARHPFVERSMILNQGNQSELTIRFVEGRNPPFRVEANGNNLEVTIGR